MKREDFTVEDRQCVIFTRDDPEVLLVQPAGEEETAGMEKQMLLLEQQTDVPFLMAAFKVKDWNGELTPWKAPPVFGKEGFGDGAEDTLSFITKKLIPAVCRRYGLSPEIPVILGGYSLAGLFSLWSAYRTDAFQAAAAVSPSVWFPGWMDFAKENRIRADSVYLSLGDREEKTKNPVMSSVGSCIRTQFELLNDGNTYVILEWNEGNHFKDPEMRCAKGFAWCMAHTDLAQRKKNPAVKGVY